MPNRLLEAERLLRARELHRERLQNMKATPTLVQPRSGPRARPVRAAPARPDSAPPTTANLSIEHRLHMRRLQAISDGSDGRRQRQEADRRQEVGRFSIGSLAGHERRRVQASVAEEAQRLRSRIDSAKPRFATPSEIKTLQGAGWGGGAGAARRRAANALAQASSSSDRYQ